MKKTMVCILLLAALCLALYACGGNASSGAAADSAPGGTASASETSDAQAPGTEITDEELLSMLWRDYIYVGYFEAQQREYASADELDADETVHLAYMNYLQYGDGKALKEMTVPEDAYDSNEQLMKGDIIYILPADEMAREVEKRYDTSIADPAEYFSAVRHTNYMGPYYLPKENAVAFRVATPQEIRNDSFVEYPGPAWFGMYIEKALQFPDGHIEITLPDFNSIGGEDIITKRYTYALSLGEDGNYRFQSCRIDYEKLGLYSFEGKYQLIDNVAEKLPKQDKNSYCGVTLTAENEDSFYLSVRQIQYDNRADASLLTVLRVDKSTMEVTGELEIETALSASQFTAVDVEIYETAEGLRVCDAHKVLDFDWELKPIRRTKLPEALDIGFYCYTVNADCSKWYCSDTEGLWSWSEREGKRLLVPATLGEGKLMEGAIIAPRGIKLVANDSLLFYFLPGYEQISGCYLLDIASGDISEFWTLDTTENYVSELQPRETAYLSGYTLSPSADAEGMALYYAIYDYAKERYNTLLYHYRFADGSWQELCESDSGLGTLLLNGDTLALTNSGKTMDYYATVYDLATGESRPAGYEIRTKNGGGQYLGVLRDGRILYYYNENPKEYHLALLG